MSNTEKIKRAFDKASESEALLEEISLTHRPANVAAREHLTAARGEMYSLHHAETPHVPNSTFRSRKELAQEVHVLFTTLLDQLAVPAQIADQYDPDKNTLEQLRSADLDTLLLAIGRLRRWASCTEVELRRLKHRLDEERRRAN